MKKVIDRQIHANELKLRLLLTNYCNLNCPFCLNDFQEKGSTFLDTSIAEMAIAEYCNAFQGVYPLQVYYSGGEPSQHPNLSYLMKIASSLGCYVTLNTNGRFSNKIEDELTKYANQVHFGTYKKSIEHALRIKRMKGTLQCIFSTRYPYVNEQFIDFYAKYDIPIKIFRDFFEDGYDRYEQMAEDLVKRFPEIQLSFRHTGIQENRGPGCDNCQKTCITLKAAWIFPNGGTSPCPQAQGSKIQYPNSSEDWQSYFQSVRGFHTI